MSEKQLEKEEINTNRRSFIKNAGIIGGGGLLLASFPWLQSCAGSDEKSTALLPVSAYRIAT